MSDQEAEDGHEKARKGHKSELISCEYCASLWLRDFDFCFGANGANTMNTAMCRIWTMATLRAIFCTASGGLNLTLQTTGRASGFTYRAPALLFLALLALPWQALAWSTNVWPATNTSPRALAWLNGSNKVYAKDAWQYDCWSGMIQRASAIDGAWSTNAPPFYRYEQANCATVKWWIAENCGSFLDHTKADTNGSFDAYLADHAEVFPVWTVTGLVAALSLPTNFFTYTPYRSLHTSAYGWDNLTNALAALRWTRQSAFWVSGEVGESNSCGIVCFPNGTDPQTLPGWTTNFSGFSCSAAAAGAPPAVAYAAALEASYGIGALSYISQVSADCAGPCAEQLYYIQDGEYARHVQEVGYPITRGQGHPVLAGVTVATDFYAALLKWNGLFVSPATNGPLIRIETLAASTGNYVDTIGDIGPSFGDEWATQRLFKASSIFPSNRDGPLFSGYTAGVDEDVDGSALSCYADFLAFLLSDCGITPGTPAECALLTQGYGVDLSASRELGGQSAVLKWNFTYD